jgi:uncharacterized sulfatase
MTQPDILFIVLDTQRADRLGCYGHRPITPNLDQLAAGGARFTQAVAPAQWTIPSHASMFTGVYPTAHQVTQSSQALSKERPHIAELLHASGYETIGFCNNPLVGILNNGFKRGFETFYNYGGAVPSLPRSSSNMPPFFGRIAEAYTQFLRRISYPIQNFFGQSDLAFRLSLNAWLTPLWSKLANFKGQNERSINDVVHFLQQREAEQPDEPLFMFVNLMETHLPFWPPNEYINQVAPYLLKDPEAQKVMHRWNREAYRWAAPLAEPLTDLEERVLNDLYDAEVAYQDAYLGRLFATLEERSNRDNTLTIILSDHGDALGDHGYIGHTFVAYEELVHVPLMMHWPAEIRPNTTLTTPVSTRRVFHTLLDAAGAGQSDLSLMHTIDGHDPENGTAFAEVFPPLNFTKAIEHRQPGLLARHRCYEPRRAVVRDNHKLIRISAEPVELFDLQRDPAELENVKELFSAETDALNRQLNQFVTEVERERDSAAAGAKIIIEDDQLRERMRGLGYIE